MPSCPLQEREDKIVDMETQILELNRELSAMRTKLILQREGRGGHDEEDHRDDIATHKEERNARPSIDVRSPQNKKGFPTAARSRQLTVEPPSSPAFTEDLGLPSPLASFSQLASSPDRRRADRDREQGVAGPSQVDAGLKASLEALRKVRLAFVVSMQPTANQLCFVVLCVFLFGVFAWLPGLCHWQEEAELRTHCRSLETQNATYRAVISDMRSTIEEMSGTGAVPDMHSRWPSPSASLCCAPPTPSVVLVCFQGSEKSSPRSWQQ